MEMFERFKIYSSFLPTLQILFLLLDLLIYMLTFAIEMISSVKVSANTD